MRLRIVEVSTVLGPDGETRTTVGFNPINDQGLDARRFNTAALPTWASIDAKEIADVCDQPTVGQEFELVNVYAALCAEVRQFESNKEKGKDAIPQ